MTPKEGSVYVASDTELRIRFDGPMHPSMLQLVWTQGGFHACGQIRYDETKQEFTLPAQLEAGCKHRLVINPKDESGAVKGFQSVHGTSAHAMTWTFSTKDNAEGTQKTAHTCSGSGKTRSVVEQFNRTRNSMQAFVQTVNTREYGAPGSQGFQTL
ncbi:MAG: hypothetical protein GY809_29250, partial [Planctomycetes bacterium]|nr:hypothetical protein [Planctomycetota bacterium]